MLSRMNFTGSFSPRLQPGDHALHQTVQPFQRFCRAFEFLRPQTVETVELRLAQMYHRAKAAVRMKRSSCLKSLIRIQHAKIFVF
jgi:hypothetical protein